MIIIYVFFSFLFFKPKMSSAPSIFINEQRNGKMCLRGIDPDQPAGHPSRTASAVLFCSIHVKPAFKLKRKGDKSNIGTHRPQFCRISLTILFDMPMPDWLLCGCKEKEKNTPYRNLIHNAVPSNKYKVLDRIKVYHALGRLSRRQIDIFSRKIS